MNNIILGYACINEQLKDKGFSFQTMTVKHFDMQKLKQRVYNNFEVTLKIIKFNIENNILLYRFSSDLILLATHELNNWNWYEDEYILKLCKEIRKLCKQHNIQTSLHPSQYLCLNSNKVEVINNSYKDLVYHYRLAKLLGCKCILIHVGGVYGDKLEATKRFVKVFNKLPEQIQNIIFLENDDKSYNVEEVLSICNQIKRPMIMDFHHNRCLPSALHLSEYIDDILNTWQYTDLKPKCHLSSSEDKTKIIRNHAEYIEYEDLLQCIKDTQDKMNIMLECKMKEKALFKLMSEIEKEYKIA